MDEEERAATNIIRILLETSVLSFAGAGVGGLLLGPEGLAIGAAVSGGIHMLTAGDRFSSWNDLRSAQGWAGLVKVTLKVAAKLLIENWQMLYKLALFIAGLLKKVFDANHSAPVSY